MLFFKKIITLKQKANAYQEEFFVNQLFRSLYKPIVSERLSQFGVQKKTYTKRNTEKEFQNLLLELKNSNLFEEQEKSTFD